MNKLIRAAGMLSLGVTSLAVQNTVSAAEGGTKPWTISAGLRGFYDDNIYTAPKTALGRPAIESWGFEISPSLDYVAAFNQTTVSLGYGYTGRYFEVDDHWDQSHRINGELKHDFSPRLSLELGDTFAVFQEPTQFLTGLVQRTKGDNINNDAHIGLTAVLAPRFSAVLSYRNGIYDYSDPAYEAVLNRVEHLPALNLRYQVLPTTVAVLGYQYGITRYDDNQALPNGQLSSVRDSNSHSIFAGVDHGFNGRLTGSLRGGAQIADFENAPGYDSTSPYADASLKYAYSTGGSLQVGVKHQLNPTDIASTGLDAATGILVQNQESTAVYAVLSQQITSKVNGRLSVQYQNSEFQSRAGGSLDGQSEDFLSVGATLSYALTRYLSTELAYYFTNLESESVLLRDREYSRNRVFLGIRATY